jgi:2-ketoarginine methyltransferase
MIRREHEDAGESSFRSSLFGYGRGFGASYVVHHLLAEGVFDALDRGAAWEEIASERRFQLELFQAVLEFLTVEGLLRREGCDAGAVYRLTEWGRAILPARGYLSLLVGGYAQVFQHLPAILRGEPIGPDRRSGGLASGPIAKLDTVRLTRELVTRHDPDCRSIVDFCCGDARYLVALSSAMDGIKAVGVEPDRAAYEAGLEAVARAGLAHRIEIVRCEVLDYRPSEPPGFMVLNFVLQEIVGRSGIFRTIELLRAVGERLQGTKLLVFEIDHAIEDRATMRTEVGLGFYNPYFMLHPLTSQKLLPCKVWEQVFSEAGLRVLERRAVGPEVDPAGLLVAYVLEASR